MGFVNVDQVVDRVSHRVAGLEGFTESKTPYTPTKVSRSLLHKTFSVHSPSTEPHSGRGRPGSNDGRVMRSRLVVTFYWEHPAGDQLVSRRDFLKTNHKLVTRIVGAEVGDVNQKWPNDIRFAYVSQKRSVVSNSSFEKSETVFDCLHCIEVPR